MKPKFDSVFLALGGQQLAQNRSKMVKKLWLKNINIFFFLFRALWRRNSLMDFWSFIFWPFWIYFGPILGQIWISYGPYLGFNTKCTNFWMKNNALLFENGPNWLCGQNSAFWLFKANFGPILAQFRPKMPKCDPVKLVSKIFI